MVSTAVLQQEGLRIVQESPHPYIIGIDEVGLGSSAGPLTVAGAVFPKGWAHELVKDSKLFTESKTKTAHEKRLEVCHQVVLKYALYYRIEQVSAEEIDTLGIETILHDLGRMVYVFCTSEYPDSLVVMDGLMDHHLHKDAMKNTIGFPKADALVPAVSAASILAKVTRDAYMIEADSRYPGYFFKKSKGYPTKEHKAAVQRLGLCDEHRRSYRSNRLSPYIR